MLVRTKAKNAEIKANPTFDRAVNLRKIVDIAGCFVTGEGVDPPLQAIRPFIMQGKKLT